jgi:hypothetical protein
VALTTNNKDALEHAVRRTNAIEIVLGKPYTVEGSCGGRLWRRRPSPVGARQRTPKSAGASIGTRDALFGLAADFVVGTELLDSRRRASTRPMTTESFARTRGSLGPP